MTKEAFIEQIAAYVIRWKLTFKFGVPSAIIAQACLESAYGTSNKALRHNYFGLKFRLNRVECNSGIFTDTSYEQKSDGSYVPIVTQWYSFPDMNFGVQGYFQFIDSGHYDSAKRQSTPEGYLQALKDSGYATSKNYVSNLLNVINKWNLTRFDGEIMIPDSKLVSGVIPSPNYTAQRKYKIDTIIIHCMAGTYDAKRCGEMFANPNRGASSHYGISSDGTIYQYVPEKYRAWTTGGDKTCNGWTGSDYDHRSITMEVSNSTLAPDYQVTPQCMSSIINLCADICRRNGIKELKWSNNPKLVGNAELQNMAVHRWFASKSCPGNFLMACIPNIALTVNQMLTAPEGYILNGYDYSPVFDPEFYANKYPDLMGAFGLNKDALWLHFQQFGMNEFRQASAEFNPVFYQSNNPDVQQAFGDDLPMYYFHYVAFGKNEGRSGA